MRPIHAPKTREQHRYRRHLRVRKKLSGTAAQPRLAVYRSLRHIYAQLVDDDRGVTLLGVSDLSEGLPAAAADAEPTAGAKVQQARAVGQLLAQRAKAAGITRVVFDRSGYRYHGRVQAVADGAREGGLEF